ncbi:SubName: Full=Uncharacterized protein {ECO:0000313/EMBL:CCA75705.1} [Serendipita indica DSM 11827]|uniref:Uncharacterized protein n=1 Tax=Serendipita indica (strain DSM 11827) TaxID=1109443 RepID=G4TWL2_SERID|nr:SubName: Full=Uncharacterized protein {ECO:0000313/EMBL:CCA75705.1} [Serendipita indica DSM 11827]CCA75705.1 hypothetical protein PIIN_09695 [Serendipita indica DSM 11827]
MSSTKSLLAVSLYGAIIASAFYTIVTHLEQSGGAALLEAGCPPQHLAQFSKTYGTGIKAIDNFLCGADVFFTVALEEGGPVETLTRLFTLNGAVMSFVLLLEASRSDKPYAAFVSVVFGLAMQVITAAISFSTFWMLFVAQAYWSTTRSGKKPLKRVDVEAALLATLGGYMIPTAWMLLTKSTWAIVVWQPFPVYMSIIQQGWTFYRAKASPRNEEQLGSGWDLLQLSLLLFSGIGTISWIYILLPYVTEASSLSSILLDLWNWLPTWDVPSPSATTIQSAALHLLQYDALWAFGSTILASILLTDDIKDVLFAVQTLPVLVVLFGPGSVIGGLWMFREMRILIEEQERAVKKAK